MLHTLVVSILTVNRWTILTCRTTTAMVLLQHSTLISRAKDTVMRVTFITSVVWRMTTMLKWLFPEPTPDETYPVK